ncbi:MAG: DUF5998 family protein [Bifidobacteriaceae bacterium]|jgi:hypothetical protein|nr:DUF5998 family protein [Bifidobacteriaceae bacterium]
MLQHQELHDQLESVGYFPKILGDVVDGAVAGEPIKGFYVQPDVAFGHGTIGRHLSVLVLTARRLIVVHADDHAPDEHGPAAVAASAESVPLAKLGAVTISRIYSDPTTYEADAVPRVVRFALGWGATQSLDLEPAGCGDPECEVDHGYAGTLAGDDISLSVTADGAGDQAVAQLLAFAQQVSVAAAAAATVAG